jgi:hypothetical protein
VAASRGATRDGEGPGRDLRLTHPGLASSKQHNHVVAGHLLPASCGINQPG